MDIVTYALSKKYIAESLDGLGALKGANCVIESVDTVPEGNRVTFSWTGISGTKETTTILVKNGEQGNGVVKVEKIKTVDLVDTYRITFTDNSTFDYEVTNGKDGQGGTGASTWSEILDKPFESLSTDFSVENGELKVVGGTGGSGEENKIDSISVNGTPISIDENKNVDITVPSIDGLAKTEDIPTTVAELTDSADYAKTADVNDSISTLQTDKADASDLTAHTDDADIHVTAENKAIWNTVSDKVDKEEGKGLSANDYTNEEKALVGTIEDKINKTSIATTLDDTVTDEQVASALLAKTELDKKVDKTSIATELSEASTDEEVVGALTAYNELKKLESANKEQFTTASGDYITVTDSVDGNIIELGVKGNSFQKTYSGKNLLIYPYTDTTIVNSGVTFTDNGDGSITIDGTNTTDQLLSFWLFSSNPDDEYKRENLYGKQLIVSGLKTDVGNIKIESYYKTTDDEEYWFRPTVNDDYFTITYPSKSEVVLMNLVIVIYPNGVVNKVTVKPMIRLATETDSSYEPYVGGIPSPSPLYPQAINSVGDDGSLVVNSCGKNLIPYPYSHDSGNYKNVIITINDDRSITLNGTNSGVTGDYGFAGTSTIYYMKNMIRLKEGHKYRLSLEFFSGSLPSTSKVIINGWNDYSYVRGLAACDSDATSFTFTVPVNSGIKWGCVYLQNRQGHVFNNVRLRPMLVEVSEDGTYPTEYEPYNKSTTTIPLSEPLRAIGDIKDEITYQDGKWGILRRIKEINLADLTWELVNNDTYQYWRYLVNDGKEASSYNSIANIIAEKYIASSWSNTVPLNSATNIIAYGFNDTSESSKFLAVSNGSTTESPTGKFLYELVTPTFELFADQTLPYLSTYNGVTNISNDDALSAEMTVKYPTTDASGIGSRNKSRIAELANGIYVPAYATEDDIDSLFT